MENYAICCSYNGDPASRCQVSTDRTFCNVHWQKFSSLYLKYKSLEKKLLLDADEKIPSGKGIKYYLNLYANLTQIYDKRIQFRNEAIAYSARDIGHQIRIDKIESLLDECFSMLEKIFSSSPPSPLSPPSSPATIESEEEEIEKEKERMPILRKEYHRLKEVQLSHSQLIQKAISEEKSNILHLLQSGAKKYGMEIDPYFQCLYIIFNTGLLFNRKDLIGNVLQIPKFQEFENIYSYILSALLSMEDLIKSKENMKIFSQLIEDSTYVVIISPKVYRQFSLQFHILSQNSKSIDMSWGQNGLFIADRCFCIEETKKFTHQKFRDNLSFYEEIIFSKYGRESYLRNFYILCYLAQCTLDRLQIIFKLNAPMEKISILLKQEVDLISSYEDLYPLGKEFYTVIKRERRRNSEMKKNFPDWYRDKTFLK